MVSRLIEKEDISLEEHSTSKGQLHLPTTRQATDRLRLTNFIETDSGESLLDLGLSGKDTLVINDELEDRGIFLATIDIVLDVESANLVGGREALDLTIGDSPHEGRLSGTVLTAETVTVTTLETESSGVEQDLSTVSQRELAVAKILALLLILGNFTIIGILRSRANDPLAGSSDGIGGGDGGKERSEELPVGNLEGLGVHGAGSEGSNILDNNVGGIDLATELLVDRGQGLESVGSLNELERRKIGTVTLGHLANRTEGGNSPSNNSASFGITNSSLDLKETRKELGKERSDSYVRVDQLGHVVNNAIFEYVRIPIDTGEE